MAMRYERRFWSRLTKEGPFPRLDSGAIGRCWQWLGPKLKSGYGRCGILTHRLSYLIHKGPIPRGVSVLHQCDNPSCVNPDHLFLGTQQDNLADMRRKGRQVRGEAQGLAKITDEIAGEIKARYRRYDHRNGSGAIARDLRARGIDISPITVWKIATDKTWRHV